MNSFQHGVCLGITSGDNLSIETVLVSEHVANFFRELLSPIHDYFCRPWVASEPRHLKDVGYIISTLLVDFFNLEPSGCGINHGETVKYCFVLFFPELVRTHQVNTWDVPWNDFWVWLRRKLAKLLVLGFEALTDVASSTQGGDRRPHTLPTIVLAHGEFHPGFSWM